MGRNSEIIKLSKLIAKLSTNTNLNRSFTPVNFNQEKQKFFKSKTYNPQFKYLKRKLNPSKDLLNSILISLNEIRHDKDWYDYFNNYLQDYLDVVKLNNSIGDDKKFPQISKKIFDELIEELPKKIKLSADLEEKDEEYESLNFLERNFTKYLNFYNLPTEVFLSDVDMSTLKVSYEKLTLSKGIQKSREDCMRLIVHEIESHLLQTHNNIEMNMFPHLRYSITFKQTLFSEGLAVYNEYKTKSITDLSKLIYKARIKAYNMSDKTFREIYNELEKLLPQEIAYNVVYRVKRGLSDTSGAGGYFKDTLYYLGYREVRKLLEEEGIPYEFFYLGKVTDLEYDLLKKHYKEVRNVITLPQFYKSA